MDGRIFEKMKKGCVWQAVCVGVVWVSSSRLEFSFLFFCF